MSFRKRYALSIPLIYASIGALWILFSDRILASFVHDIELYAQYQTYKGWVYVCATSFLLYLLIRAYVFRVEKYEKELKKERDYNRLLFEKSSMGLVLCKIDGTLVDVNEAYAKIIGRTVDETLKLTYWDITPQEYKEEELKQIESLKNTGRYGPYEKYYIHKDGHLVPVRLQGILIKINGEEFILSSVEDITELKIAEKALKESEQRYREVVDNATSVILRLSIDGKINFINKFGVEFFGFSYDELIGKDVIGTIVPERETTGRDLKEFIS
ncbi:MAG: PAS domain S-box protein, partial [Thermodesulfovibrio sp.]|nr:PAS domain S-box protein [Thermodesulfovibrio sp.]